MSFAIVHFLVMAQSARGEYLYRARLLNMLRMLHDGKATGNAFTLSFGTNVRGFQDRFTEYAQELQPTAEATLIENQAVLADNESNPHRAIVAYQEAIHLLAAALEQPTDDPRLKYFVRLFVCTHTHMHTHAAVPQPF